jgi:hypothetical protein
MVYVNTSTDDGEKKRRRREAAVMDGSFGSRWGAWRLGMFVHFQTDILRAIATFVS